MDKLRVFIVLSMLLSAPIAAASDMSRPLEIPDFNRFPATEVADLSIPIGRKLRDAHNRGSLFDPFDCENRIDVLLGVYVERWPQFAEWVNDPDWRTYWADHFGKGVYRGEIGCHFVNPIRAVLHAEDGHYDQQEQARQIPRWCGRWRDGAPTIAEDHAVAALIELAFEDVIPDAVWKLYSESQSHSWRLRSYVGMNPDVALLLIERSKVFAEFRNVIIPLRLSDEDARYALLHTVPDERRREIRQAARSGDWRSILETTAPCRPSDELFAEAGLPSRVDALMLEEEQAN